MTRTLITRLPDDEAEQVKNAARAGRLTQQEYCRRVLLDAARRDTGAAPDDVRDMLREVLGILKPEARFVGDENDAYQALLQLGITKTTAARKVRLIGRESPGLTAAEIIARATKPAD